MTWPCEGTILTAMRKAKSHLPHLLPQAWCCLKSKNPKYVSKVVEFIQKASKEGVCISIFLTQPPWPGYAGCEHKDDIVGGGEKTPGMGWRKTTI